MLTLWERCEGIADKLQMAIGVTFPPGPAAGPGRGVQLVMLNTH